MVDIFAAVQFFWGFVLWMFHFFPSMCEWMSECACVCVCVVACQEGKKTFTRKQCFYSNCYSVAHSWHYFPSLIKFHPNHNSNHVGALLQSLSNAHYHHRTSCHHHVRLCVQYNTIIQYNTCIHTYISDISMTFPKSQFHTSIYYYYIFIYMCWTKRKKKSWSTTVFYILLSCV